MKFSWWKVTRSVSLLIVFGMLAAILYLFPLFPIKAVYYIQRYHHDQELCYMDVPDDANAVSSIDKTLTEYGERHIVIHNKILIPLRLLSDMDLLRNYTTKAGLKCPDKNFKRHSDPASDLWVEAKQ